MLSKLDADGIPAVRPHGLAPPGKSDSRPMNVHRQTKAPGWSTRSSVFPNQETLTAALSPGRFARYLQHTRQACATEDVRAAFGLRVQGSATFCTCPLLS